MTAAIETTGLTKIYGDKLALDSVDLLVEEGSVFGFLGANGAGKTTMLRLLTGLTQPTSGSMKIVGQNVETAGNAVRAQIGVLPDVPGFYDWMTAGEFLRFAGGLFGIEQKILAARSQLLLDQAGLGDVTARIGGFSRGMKQRLGIAQALINAPRLLLLDEPTSALDPVGRKDILDMIAALRGRTTVFFSTHILGDVERVCDTVAILDHGRIVARAPIHELKARYGRQKVFVEVTSGADALAEEVRRQVWANAVSTGSTGPEPTAGDSTGGTIEITVCDVAAARRDIPALVAARGLGLTRFEAGEMGLEEVFVELVGQVQR
ncbi:ABC-2 type transport system ATP-binding protein [Cryobacterium sp. MP_M5]|uniref:ABC transporter ATP-binding protein n=1 Tax=unclassified Cryobacterium TaxID=2649013 RepID=UPI0018C8F1D9|nr:MULTISPECIES: ABC transporter ATP-binding protein [unclassified Cryobacterium]MBG6060056.1 ABC-2 type transport system ATP-binding protein [Cryobacterium sp. MP_M3]MEC5178466.1 ABC-2 type transport system ATP-binding protein [Cryobacterium sp. MP_M5]